MLSKYHDKAIIPMLPIQEFCSKLEEFKNQKFKRFTRQSSRPENDIYEKDLDAAHKVFRDLGYTNDKVMTKNAPFIKMVIEDSVLG